MCVFQREVKVDLLREAVDAYSVLTEQVNRHKLTPNITAVSHLTDRHLNAIVYMSSQMNTMNTTETAKMKHLH